MKICAFSDIHGNIEAFDKMISNETGNVDAYIFAGDIWGYFYDQSEIIDRLSAITNLYAVKGNHDEYYLGREITPELINKYGSSYSYRQFEFSDEKGESYNVDIEYSSDIKVLRPPKIALYSSYKVNYTIKENVEEISKKYSNYFENLYKLKYMILLKDQYTVMPASFIISTALNNTKSNTESNTKSTIISVLVIGFFLLLVIVMIYYSIKRNIRRKQIREQLILLRAQRDLQYMQPYQINAGIDQDALKRNNTMKVNTLFDTKLVEHLYKEEYNQYGGGYV